MLNPLKTLWRVINSHVAVALLSGLSTGAVIWAVKSQSLQVTQLQDAISLANSVSQSQEAINKALDGVKSDEVIRIVSGEIDKIKGDVATSIAAEATSAVVSQNAFPFSEREVEKLKNVIGLRELTAETLPIEQGNNEVIGGEDDLLIAPEDTIEEEIPAAEAFVPFEDIVTIEDVPITCQEQTAEIGSDFGVWDVWFNPYLLTTATGCSFVVDVYLEPTALPVDTYRLVISYPANLLEASGYSLGNVYNFELPGSGIENGTVTIGAYGIDTDITEKTLVGSINFTTLATGSAKIKFETSSHLLHNGSDYGSYSGLGNMIITIK